ncbi:TspO/MBR family protein [Pedobacter sp. AW31-3R]|uniref:TspO/MBR family protein n=1 Tax=Pedobacter sp. AW31-3R TaxID=3445781 RepID=UPI003FA16E13
MMAAEKRSIQFVPLLMNLFIPYIIAGLGGLITVKSVNTWYPSLSKPAFNPPNWLFGPVWSVLFLLIGISAYRVWIKRKQIIHFPRTVAIYFIQLILNLGWSFLFFYSHQIGAALIEIFALLISIAINAVVFYKIDKTAGLLFIPYFLWVSFASFLTYSFFILN